MIGAARRQGPARRHARDARPRRLRRRRRRRARAARGGASCSTAPTRRAPRGARARPARRLRADAHARRRQRPPRSPRSRARAVTDVSVTGAARAPRARAGRRPRRACSWSAAERCAGGLRDGDVVCVAQKAVSKVEGRSVALDERAAVRRARSRSPRDEGDPRMIELILRRERAHRAPPRRVPGLRDPPRLRLRRGGRRPLERGRRATSRSCCRSIPTPPRARLRDAFAAHRRGRRDHHRLVRPAVPARHDGRGGGLRRARAGARAHGRQRRRRARAAGHRAARGRSDRLGRRARRRARSAACPRRSCAAWRSSAPTPARAPGLMPRRARSLPRRRQRWVESGHDSQRQGQSALRHARRSGCSAS